MLEGEIGYLYMDTPGTVPAAPDSDFATIG